MISKAGPNGISRRELGRCLDLDGPILDQLRALVNSGQLVAWKDEGGDTIYKTVPWIRGIAGHARTAEREIRGRG